MSLYSIFSFVATFRGTFTACNWIMDTMLYNRKAQIL